MKLTIQQEMHSVRLVSGHRSIDCILKSKRIWDILSLWNKLKLHDKKEETFFLLVVSAAQLVIIAGVIMFVFCVSLYWMSFSCSLIEAECYFEPNQPSRLLIKARGQSSSAYRLQHMLFQTMGPHVKSLRLFYQALFEKKNYFLFFLFQIRLSL